jgi:TonB family protein
VHFRLSVDARGKVSDCHIQRSTRPEGFDEAVCEVLMHRARFKPALDAEGKPMASYYINTVRFIIP